MIKLKDTLLNGELISIKDDRVTSGLGNYYCPDPNCNSELVAKKGEFKTHHFAHKNDTDLCYGYETSLHLRAKDIINTLTELVLPKFYFSKTEAYKFFLKDIYQIEKSYDFYLFSEVLLKSYQLDIHDLGWKGFEIIPSKRINLEEYQVKCEYCIDKMIPDIILEHKVKPTKIHVEIGVTHMVDKIKKRKIEEADLTFLEFDFSKYYKTYNDDDIENDLITYFKNPEMMMKDNFSKYSSISKHWIYIKGTDLEKFLLLKKEYIIKYFTDFLKEFQNFYETEIKEIFLDYNLSIEEVNVKNFIKDSCVVEDRYQKLIECPIVFKFLKKQYLESEEGKLKEAKITKRKRDRIDLHNRLWEK